MAISTVLIVKINLGFSIRTRLKLHSRISNPVTHRRILMQFSVTVSVSIKQKTTFSKNVCALGDKEFDTINVNLSFISASDGTLIGTWQSHTTYVTEKRIP